MKGLREPFFHVQNRRTRGGAGPRPREDLRSGRLRSALVCPLGEGWPLPAVGPGGRAALRDGHPSAQRHRAAPHRARVRPDGRGHPRPLEAHARPPRALGARHRPRGHRDPDGRRAPAREGRDGPALARTREVHRARLGLAPRVRRRDPRAAAPARVLARLEPAPLHDGRGSLARGAARLRAALLATA